MSVKIKVYRHVLYIINDETDTEPTWYLYPSALDAFNNGWLTTHKDILCVLDRAIEIASKETT